MLSVAPKFGVRIADLKNGVHYRYTAPDGGQHTIYVDLAGKPEETVDVTQDGKTARISCFVGIRGGLNRFATVTTGIEEGGHLKGLEVLA